MRNEHRSMADREAARFVADTLFQRGHIARFTMTYPLGSADARYWERHFRKQTDFPATLNGAPALFRVAGIINKFRPGETEVSFEMRSPGE